MPDPAPHASPDPQAAELTTLLRAAAAGDEEAWRTIVGLYARRVYGLARSRLCPGAGGPRHRSTHNGLWVQGHDIAEEVTQSVFVTIATKLSSGEYTEQGRFESWLFRVAMNRVRDEARRVRRQATPADPETFEGRAADTGVTDHDSGDELVSLRRALAELSEPDREIVELRHHAGLSFKQMADLLAEPIGTLLARHHRALRKLKDLMTSPLTSPVSGPLSGPLSGPAPHPLHINGETP